MWWLYAIVEWVDVDGVTGDDDGIRKQVAVGETCAGDIHEYRDGAAFTCRQHWNRTFNDPSRVLGTVEAEGGLHKCRVDIQRISNNDIKGVGRSGVADEQFVLDGTANTSRVGGVLFFHRNIDLFGDGGDDRVLDGVRRIELLGEGAGGVGELCTLTQTSININHDLDGGSFVQIKSAQQAKDTHIADATVTGRGGNEGRAFGQGIEHSHIGGFGWAVVGDDDGVSQLCTGINGGGVAEFGDGEGGGGEDLGVLKSDVVVGVGIGRAACYLGAIHQTEGDGQVRCDIDRECEGLASADGEGVLGGDEDNGSDSRLGSAGAAVGRVKGGAVWQGIGDHYIVGGGGSPILDGDGVEQARTCLHGVNRIHLGNRHVGTARDRRIDGYAIAGTGRGTGDAGCVLQTSCCVGCHCAMNRDSGVASRGKRAQVAGQVCASALAAQDQRLREIGGQNVGYRDILGIRWTSVGDDDGIAQVFARCGDGWLRQFMDIQVGQGRDIGLKLLPRYRWDRYQVRRCPHKRCWCRFRQLCRQVHRPPL